MTKRNPEVVLGALESERLPIAFSTTAPFSRQRVADYLSLTKPRLNFLVVVTAAVGYYLGAHGDLHLVRWAEAVAGTALVAGGAAGLNQVHERDTDGLMWRTRNRPLAAHRLSPGEGTTFSLALATAGVALLFTQANALAAALAMLTLLSYTAVYTPMKRRSQLATLVGAVPGALPPAIGWAAATGTLTPGAWALVAIVFVWQIPHFMAIAWLYREDFGRGGFPLLPVVEPDGKSTARQAVLFALLLVAVTLAPYVLQMAGAVYAAGALLGSLVLLGLTLSFAAARTNTRARRIFIASITYLPLLWLLLVADRV